MTFEPDHNPRHADYLHAEAALRRPRFTWRSVRAVLEWYALSELRYCAPSAPVRRTYVRLSTTCPSETPNSRLATG